MKTNIFKLSCIIILVSAAIGAYAQSSDSKKTCIKIDEITNGKVIKIDTCFTGMTQAEIQKQLIAMGISDPEDINEGMDSVRVIINKSGDEIDSAHKEVIIINNEESGTPGGGNVKVISNKSGRYNTVIVKGNEDTYTSSDNDGLGRTEVIVKKISGDSNHSETKIYVFNKTEAQNSSDSDKVKGRTGVNGTTHLFDGLQVYPNPVESTITISYNSSGKEPLNIKVYDANGKTVYNDNVKDPGQQVNQTISLSALSPGIYFVSLVQGNQNETRKVLVK